MKPFESSQHVVFVNKNFDETNSQIDSQVIILKVECDSLDLVGMYAENLINDDGNNELAKEVETPKEIPNVFYVKFKNPIDYQHIQERILRRPYINNK